ncbi:hypothetical protein J2X57_003208 [Luteibacter sp. 1214]|uniref:hypothetical protein n=1 Tax=Luteibacter sp. 1214 TaxID=2817735 RepID=UPI00285C17C6|nr:hypothetical protein [Luteibacter sp. 1214]MDR6643973.1 hypothetical protein [Luteibacter sp. 1214]
MPIGTLIIQTTEKDNYKRGSVRPEGQTSNMQDLSFAGYTTATDGQRVTYTGNPGGPASNVKPA